MRFAIPIFILLSIQLGTVIATEFDTQKAAKARNALLEPFADPKSGLDDFQAHVQHICTEYFFTDCSKTRSFSEALAALINLDVNAVVSSEDFLVKGGPDSIESASLAIFEQEKAAVLAGDFSQLFSRLDRLQKQLNLYQLAKNLQSNKVVGRIVWNSSLYKPLLKAVKDAAPKTKTGQAVVGNFIEQMGKFFTAQGDILKVYNQLEDLQTNTKAILHNELYFILYSVFQKDIQLDQSNKQVLASKAVSLLVNISSLKDSDAKGYVFEAARTIMNKRLEMYQNDTLDATTNEWILELLSKIMTESRDAGEGELAFAILQKMLSKEVPQLINRSELASIFVDMSKQVDIFEPSPLEHNSAAEHWRNLLLASLIIDGPEGFLTKEQTDAAVSKFGDMMALSFDRFLIYQRLCPLLFNKIVTENLSPAFVEYAFKRIADFMATDVSPVTDENVYTLFAASFDQNDEAVESENYVPLKVAIGLLAKATGTSFRITLPYANHETIERLHKLLDLAEFAKVNTILKHLYAKDFGYQLHDVNIANKDYAESIFKERLSNASFDGVVSITGTDDEDVFVFAAIEPDVDSIDEEIITEEEEEPVEQIDQIAEGSRKMRNRKGKAQPVDQSFSDIQEREIGIEPVQVELDEQETESVRQPSGEGRLQITGELKGQLTPEEYKFLTETDDLINLLKQNKGVVTIGGQRVEISYMQVAPMKTPCHAEIEKVLSNAN